MKALFSRVLLASVLVLLSSCSGGSSSAADPSARVTSQPIPPPAATTQPATETPQPLAQNGTPLDPPSAPIQPTAQIFRGTGNVVAPASAQPQSSAAPASDGDITLNFVNADVRDVAKAVLGDFLKLNYAVGANVQGNVTIQTSRPLSRDTVLPIFEQALRLNGMALVKNADIYKIVPLADAPRESGLTPVSSRQVPRQPGFGVEIVPLKYVGAAEMQKLLEPLAPAQGVLHADPVRNVLIIEGTEQERQTMLDDIALFDVDWLSGMSFALYTPRYTDSQELAKELDQIVGGRTGPLAGLVRFVPIDRLNAVLAISPQAKYLDQLQQWVERLDKPGQGSDRRIFVYHVQNGRAGDLAKVLLKVLFGENSETQTTQHAASADVFSSPSPGPGGVAAASPPNPTGLGSPMAPPPMQETTESTGTASKEMANVNITADETNNALVVMATQQQYSVIENALHELDIVPLQVMLEAAIAEVTLNNDLQYGVQYFFQPNNKQQVVLSNSSVAQITPTYPGFSYIFSPGTNIHIILNALSNVTHVEVISAPQVLVLNNQTATLEVGDQVPILTTQQQATIGQSPIINSVEYHDTGVILKVTPRVNQGGNVMMDISQEVSDVADTNTTETLGSPTIELRKINSTVAVHDGETIALGGLIKDSRTTSKNGIPFLSDIPVLGNIFRTTDNNVMRTELMVLITPHVVDSTQKARAVTEELRAKLPAVQHLFDKPQ